VVGLTGVLALDAGPRAHTIGPSDLSDLAAR
jgi:hypothetical protein